MRHIQQQHIAADGTEGNRDVQHKGHTENRRDAGNGDSQDALHPGGAVDGGSLDNIPVDIGNGGHEED